MPASNDIDVAGMIPGSELAVTNMSTLVNTCREIDTASIANLLYSQRSTGAMQILKKVAGMLIIKNVFTSDKGLSPIKHLDVFPHNLMRLCP